MTKSNITEGLRIDDLKNLVLPVISVDEYESKISKDALVIGFYVHDKDAANDLNRYIQKSAISLLDTDVSPSPNQHGFYFVFVELMNNDKVGDIIKAILDEVSPLVGIDEWRMRVRKHKGVVKFSAELLTKYIKKINRINEEEISSFFKDSDLHCLDITGSIILLDQRLYEMIDFGEYDVVITENQLADKPIDLGLHAVSQCKKLQHLLGNQWMTYKINEFFVLHKDNNIILLTESNI